jgi:hypothetical protein
MSDYAARNVYAGSNGINDLYARARGFMPTNRQVTA